jgi:hypothetical protein
MSVSVLMSLLCSALFCSIMFSPLCVSCFCFCLQIVFSVNTPAEFVDFAMEKVTEAVFSPPQFSHAVSV